MKLLLLGTAGYHANDSRQTACIMLPERGILLDAGSGLFRAAEHLATSHLDIFLSHTHLDHVIGLTHLVGMVYRRPMARVTIHGEAEKLEAVREHLFAELLFPIEPEYEFRPLQQGMEIDGGGRLSYFPLEHPGGVVGYRLDWPGASLAYVTDTFAEPQADYVEKIRGVDLLLHECSFPDGEEEFAKLTGHSNTTHVAQVAREAGVGRLVLVHIMSAAQETDPIGLAAAQAIFPDTVLGEDGMELDF